MIDEKVIGQRIGAYLKLTGRKVRWLAGEMGWTPEKTSVITCGKQRMKLTEFFKICKILDVPYQQFITDDDLKE